MKVVLKSAGKSEVLAGQVDADLYIDCRGMINPFRDPVLGGLTGDDPKVQEWIATKNAGYVQSAMLMIDTAIQSASSRNSFRRAPDKPLTVCFFCLAGVHRSRGLKNVVGKMLSSIGMDEVVIE